METVGWVTPVCALGGAIFGTLATLFVSSRSQKDNSQQSWAAKYEDRFKKYEELSEIVGKLRSEVATLTVELNSYRLIAEGRISDLKTANQEERSEVERLHGVLLRERNERGDERETLKLALQELRLAHGLPAEDPTSHVRSPCDHRG